MNLMSIIKFTILFGVLSLQTIYAQNSTARFLLWQPSAISNSMGGVGTALYDNAYTAYYNPAALAFSDRITLVGSFVKPLPFFGNITHSFIGGSVRTDKVGTFGFSANLIWKGPQPQTDVTGNEINYTTGGYTLNWQGKISYAVPVTSNFSIGTNLSLLRIKLSDGIFVENEKREGKSITVLFDLGIFWKDLLPQSTLKSNSPRDEWYIGKEKEGISIGMTLLNVGQKISFINKERSDNAPAKFMVGASYCPIFINEGSILLATDFEKQLYEPSFVDYMHLGAELNFVHLLSFRIGRFVDTKEPKTSYNTYGAGINIKYFSVNLARYEKTLLPTWHYDATFSLEF